MQQMTVTEEKKEEEAQLPEAEVSIPEPEEEGLADEPKEVFIPVSEEEPFEYLDKLENAVMDVREETVGIVLRKEE